ncbi:SRPBCC family protein [Pseudoflavitalea sp. G-6-1-2]|uniref:SRPBCC family protein n=1 Tax=Pseudoflavitalea sp. G-6-1-2 TaxID=2728841 RepID=UPI001469C034|nr:SRPBCC family protein [Pseudoflavitalea sp. G-6-1-2]NML20239.1 SRPBCC family protein [Pseudoflavitalea sp. G-6-1-2]
MSHHSIRAVQRIPVSVEQAWQFFSDPAKLVDITPAEFAFRVISRHHGPVVYQGQIIEYKVSPLLGIPLYWMTEITHVVPLKYFVDEQRYGPYRMWHHQHHFTAIDGGVEMVDIVHYSIPGWWMGRMINSILVKKKLESLFRYRFQRIEELLGKWEGQQVDVKVY